MYHERMKYLYVCIDSHKDTHYSVVLNCFGETIGELEFRNTPSAFPDFLGKIKKFLPLDVTFIFGLEDVSEYGLNLAKYLIKEEFEVKHVNSSLVATERQSTNILHKTDSFDALCATRVLISKFNSLHTFVPNDSYISLNLLVTKRNYIVKNASAIKRELQRLIAKNYPSYKKFFHKIDTKSSLVFFEKYPSPQILRNTSHEEIVELFFEVGHVMYKDEKANLILESIEQDGDTTVDYQDVSDFIIKSLIRQLRNAQSEIDMLDVKIEAMIETFPQKLTTIQGVNTITAAALLAEIGDISRFKSPSKLARYSGVAPVTFSSGKSMVQFANEKGNRRLSAILFVIAVTISNTAGKHNKVINPIFREYYLKKIHEGKTKKQAIKCVERRLVNIIWNMLKHNTEYRNSVS